ncbi:MAG: hypothetical protein V2B18_13655, partial [Pseudomonadota bacterium]
SEAVDEWVGDAAVDAAADARMFMKPFLERLTELGYSAEQAVREWQALIDAGRPENIAVVVASLKDLSLDEAYKFALSRDRLQSDSEVVSLAMGIASSLEGVKGAAEYARSRSATAAISDDGWAAHLWRRTADFLSGAEPLVDKGVLDLWSPGDGLDDRALRSGAGEGADCHDNLDGEMTSSQRLVDELSEPRPEGATDNELFSQGYNMARFRATAGLPIPDKADLDLGDPFWRGFHDGVADHNAHGERTRQIAAGTAPELKDPVGWDTLDPFAVGSEASLNEPAGGEPVDPLDALLREFLESLKELPEEEAPDGEEEEEEEEEAGGRATGSNDTADAEMTLLKRAEERPALPSGVVETGEHPGGGTEVMSSKYRTLWSAGAMHIHWDSRCGGNGAYVGVIPSQGRDWFIDPLGDEETFIEWMALAGHTKEAAKGIWDNRRKELERARDAAGGMIERYPILGAVNKLMAFLDSARDYLTGLISPSEPPPTDVPGPFEVYSGDPMLWYKGGATRGEIIDKLLGNNTPPGHPTIDRWDKEKGIAIGIKSLDTHVVSYMSPQAITKTGEGYINEVAGFQGKRWADYEIAPEKIRAKGLDLAVPAGATEEQRKALRQLVEYGEKKGVKVRIITVR